MYPLLDVGRDTEIAPVFNNLDTLFRMEPTHENIAMHIDPNMGMLVKKFQQTGWFSPKLMTIKGIDSVSAKAFSKAVSIMSLKKGTRRSFKIEGQNMPYSGTQIDMDKFKKFFEETPSQKQEREEEEDRQIFEHI